MPSCVEAKELAMVTSNSERNEGNDISKSRNRNALPKVARTWPRVLPANTMTRDNYSGTGNLPLDRTRRYQSTPSLIDADATKDLISEEHLPLVGESDKGPSFRICVAVVVQALGKWLR